VPDSVEIDIESSNEDTKFGFIRYRKGASRGVIGPTTCEQEVAVAQKIYGISSGTYTLRRAGVTVGQFNWPLFSYSSRSIAITIQVATSRGRLQSAFDGDNAAPGIGVGISLPFASRLTKSWPACSSVSAEVATESDLDSIDYSNTYERTFTQNGVTNKISRSTGNYIRDIYGLEAISLCNGRNLVSAPDPLNPFGATDRPSLLPFSIDASTQFTPVITITDEVALAEWNGNPNATRDCCRFMPAEGLFVDAVGYEITSEVTRLSRGSSDNDIAFMFRSYALNITRTLTITGIRGRASDGTLVELLNNPLP
jgi:hypothetical protein